MLSAVIQAFKTDRFDEVCIVVGLVQCINFHGLGASRGRMDEFIVADVNTHMSESPAAGVEKYKIPFLQFVSGDALSNAGLLAGGPGKADIE
jgi:hypothetical protein